jgi:hypothetical protein
MHLDSATPQDRIARFAGCVAAVDQEDFLIGKSRMAGQVRKLDKAISGTPQARWRWPIWREEVGREKTLDVSGLTAKDRDSPKSALGEVEGGAEESGMRRECLGKVIVLRFST